MGHCCARKDLVVVADLDRASRIRKQIFMAEYMWPVQTTCHKKLLAPNLAAKIQSLDSSRSIEEECQS